MPHYAQTSLRARANALREAYPTVTHLLSGDGFEALSLACAGATPVLDWDLKAFGGDLPRYLAAQQPDADGALLSDAARLDWAMHRAAFAPDAAAQSVLVGRGVAARTWLRALDAGEAAFAACLLAGGTLGEGLQAALATAPAFDLAASLARQFGDQVWSGHSVH